MTRKARANVDPIEQEIELALNPGAFIPDRACYSFVSDLDEVAVKIAKLTASDPSRAVTLYETFLAAFVTQIRARFDDAAKATPKTDGTLKDRPEHIRRHWGEVLRTLYAAQKNVAAYVALAEETGLTAQDCHAIATLLVGRRKPGEALAWVERGIDLDKKTPHGSMANHDLAKLKRELLTKLGRGNEALDAAWADYRQHPSKYGYDDLMKFVPKAERAKWHEKAIDAAKGADHHRKSGFMSGFERLVEGTGPSDEPSFMEQAKARWGERHRRAR